MKNQLKYLINEFCLKFSGFKMSFSPKIKKTLKQKLLEDNEKEEKEIARLQKLLHIKKDSKKLRQSFYDEGLDELLDFCDEEKRKEIIKAEGFLNVFWHFSVE